MSSTIYKGLGTHVDACISHARTHARIIYQNERSLAMFGGGRSSRPRFVCSRSRSIGHSETARMLPPVSPFLGAGFRPARSLRSFCFSPTSAITYRRVITARALSRGSPGSIHTIEMTVCASAVREIEYLPPAGCSGGHTGRSLMNSSCMIAIFQSLYENYYTAFRFD